MGLGILGNISEEEMEIAIRAIEKERTAKRKGEALNIIKEAIAKVEQMGFDVCIEGGYYVSRDTKIGERMATGIKLLQKE